MAENGACGHIFAVAHGAFASGIEVVEIFPVQHDVKPDVPISKTFTTFVV